MANDSSAKAIAASTEQVFSAPVFPQREAIVIGTAQPLRYAPANDLLAFAPAIKGVLGLSRIA